MVTLLLFLLWLMLLSSNAAMQPLPSCHLQELLHCVGNHTAGREAVGPPDLQGQLLHLLQANGNHAASILTKGCRASTEPAGRSCPWYSCPAAAALSVAPRAVWGLSPCSGPILALPSSSCLPSVSP